MQHIAFNSLWPSHTIECHKSWSSLVHIMASCWMALNHYLNQCKPTVNWTLVNKRWWFLNQNTTISIQKLNLKMLSVIWQSFCSGLNVLTHKRLEMQGRVLSTLATDVLVLNHQATSTHNANKIFILMINICSLITLGRSKVSNHKKTPRYGLSQWEQSLLCNTFSYWPSLYPEWSRIWHKVVI